MERWNMSGLLVFLLGAAFGFCISSLMVYVGQAKKHGLSENLMIDIIHEIASIVFILALYYAYAIGIAHSW